MSLEWEQIIVASREPVTLGRWWLEALSWVTVDDDPQCYEIRPEPDRMPGLLFVQSAEPKTAKNRLHIDVQAGGGRATPHDERWPRVRAAAYRLIVAGATELAVVDLDGRPDHVVLADPEGNELCVV